MHPTAERAEKISPFIVMEVLERAHELESAGRRIIHLEIGEPDFPTPECVCRAAARAVQEGGTHYTHSLGIRELREAVSRHYQDTYGVAVDPGRVVVTSGTSPGLFMVFSALLNPGDQIVMGDPHYPCYPNFARFLGAEPVLLDADENEGFQPSPREIRTRTGPLTRAVLINSPANPTGTLVAPERMKEIAGLGLPVISDEIYHGLCYGDREHTILEYTDEAFVLNGFSKAYAMTGWRLGYIIAPTGFVRALQKIQQNLFISAPSMSQWAGVAALAEAGPEVEQRRAVYNERRIYMVRRLRELGFGLPVEPEGAFYVLVNAKHLARSSYELAFEILEKAGVGVSPGIDFGDNAEGYIRFSYANSLENIREGLDRIEAFLETR